MQRRTVWCPTWLGWFCVAVLLIAPAVWWFYVGESFLSLTRRLPAEVLVVEGWIGREGTRAAGQEFARGRYQYVVTAGGLRAERWGEDRSSYAEMAARELIRSGVPITRIIAASARATETHRTYESAVAVWQALRARGVQPKTLNVFTWGTHARRTRLVFAKVCQPGTEVGVVAWTPSGYEAVPWWRSSERAKELLTETAGYVYEVLLNSGRSPNALSKSASSDSV